MSRSAGGEVHETARAANPGTRTVYVSTDPLVLAHSRALRDGPGVATVDIDLTRPAAVFASLGLTARTAYPILSGLKITADPVGARPHRRRRRPGRRRRSRLPAPAYAHLQRR